MQAQFSGCNGQPQRGRSTTAGSGRRHGRTRGELLAELKADPGPVSLDTLLREIDKLTAVRDLGLPAGFFDDASEKLLAAWRARAARSWPSTPTPAPLPTPSAI